MAAMLNGASVLAWAAELLGLSIEEALDAAEGYAASVKKVTPRCYFCLT